MPDTTRFRPNTPPVLHETLDHEAILVNLDIGTYYSLNPVGTTIWGAIDRGASVDEVVASIAEQSGAAPATVQSTVSAFIDELVAEQLVVALDGDRPPEPVRAEWPEGLSSFEQPVLSRYTDMQELLLLDPVHDVGVAGWPEPR
jgi:hypothetical protein